MAAKPVVGPKGLPWQPREGTDGQRMRWSHVIPLPHVDLVVDADLGGISRIAGLGSTTSVMP